MSGQLSVNGPASLWIAEDLGCCAAQMAERGPCATSSLVEHGSQVCSGLIATANGLAHLRRSLILRHCRTAEIRRPRLVDSIKCHLPTPFTHRTRCMVLVGGFLEGTERRKEETERRKCLP